LIAGQLAPRALPPLQTSLPPGFDPPCCGALCQQVIVERCEAGIRDPLRDALDLFVDAVAIFVRLLVILLKNAQEKERRREEKERAAGRSRGMRTSRL
jgi:hypothetical protein